MSYRTRHIKPKIRNLNKKKLAKKPWFWAVLAVLTICGAVFYFVFLSEKFQIKKIEVSGNEEIMAINIEEFVLKESSSRIFLVRTEELKEKLLTQFPKVGTIKIKKKLPSHIIINIEEKKPFSVFCGNGNKCFFMDIDGIIFKELEDIPKDMFVVRSELSKKETFLGENAVEKKIIDMIYNIGKNLKNNFRLDIKEALLSDFLIIKTSENWKIYFDQNSDIDLQIIKMNILLKDEIPGEDRKDIQYIYLQYRDRAYYK